MVRKIFIVIMLISNSLISQNSIDSMSVNSIELGKYHLIAKYEAKNGFLQHHKREKNDESGLDYLNWNFEFDELIFYSIPFFQIKHTQDIDCNNFLNNINFESNPNSQIVYIEVENKLVSDFFILGNTFNFETFYPTLFYYKYGYDNNYDFPLNLGGITYDYFIDERFEKKYFSFIIKGFKGTFFVKNHEIFYAVKRLPKKYNRNELNLYDIDKFSKTELIKVNTYFLKKIENDLMIGQKTRNIFKKCFCK